MTSILAKPFGYKKVFTSMKEHDPFSKDPQWALPKLLRPKGKRVEREKAGSESARTPGPEASITPQIQFGEKMTVSDTQIPNFPDVEPTTNTKKDDPLDFSFPSPCDAPLSIDLEFLMEEDAAEEEPLQSSSPSISMSQNQDHDEEMEIENTNSLGQTESAPLKSQTLKLPIGSNSRNPEMLDSSQMKHSIRDYNPDPERNYDDFGLNIPVNTTTSSFPMSNSENVMRFIAPSVTGSSTSVVCSNST